MKQKQADVPRVLYNGIALPEQWPPNDVDPMSDEVQVPPYLISRDMGGTRPDVIDVTVGRQLFVDDFLIEHTTLERIYHHPEKYAHNPILRPETEEETEGHQHGVGTSAGGVWYDMNEGKYKMWYDVQFNPLLGYAESEDGVHWTRVEKDDSGSNIVMSREEKDGACSVFIDYDAAPDERYKMFLQSFHHHQSKLNYEWFVPDGSIDENNYAHTLWVSADGLHWRRKGGFSDGLSGDMTTVYYDALRKKWVNSIRSYARTKHLDKVYNGRVRYYAEQDTFEELLHWKREQAPFWIKCDRDDPVDEASGEHPQMYNFDAIAYESILFGFWQIWRGPENHIIAKTGDPKITEIMSSFSRDGFHFHRPDRTPFIPATRRHGDWDKGYLHCTNGGVIVHQDTVDFYYSAFSGIMPDGTKDPHADQCIGMATLRRDGFASLNGSGEVYTRNLTVSANKKFLFVNARVPQDSLRAEITDADGAVINGFSADECIAVGGDSTCKQITWRGGRDLSELNGKVFRIRLIQEKGGELYAFWLSDSLEGNSGGAVAAGYAPQIAEK